MKIAISNLAWAKEEDDQVLTILKKNNICGIELAPTKIWRSPTKTDKPVLERYKKWWQDRGIEIVATSSLLFGHPELTLFQDIDTRQKTLKYLKKMVEVSSVLGAKTVVFGSPKNRVRSEMSKQKAEKTAIEFFRRISVYAAKLNIYFAIEPNPPLYGTDFINTTEEAIKFVRKLSHPNFCVQLDASTMTINQENYLKTLRKGISFARHFHISEPGLKPVPQEETNHQQIASSLKKLGYKGWISVEMPLNDSVNRLKLIQKALDFVTRTYRS